MLITTVNKPEVVDYTNKSMDAMLIVFEESSRLAACYQTRAFRAIAEIEANSLYKVRANHSKRLLTAFEKRGSRKPWALNFREWITTIYPKFPIVSYYRVSEAVRNIPPELTDRLKIDSLEIISRPKALPFFSKIVADIGKSTEGIVGPEEVKGIVRKYIPASEIKPRKTAITQHEKTLGLIASNNELRLEKGKLLRKIKKYEAKRKISLKTIDDANKSLCALRAENTNLREKLKFLERDTGVKAKIPKKKKKSILIRRNR